MKAYSSLFKSSGGEPNHQTHFSFIFRTPLFLNERAVLNYGSSKLLNLHKFLLAWHIWWTMEFSWHTHTHTHTCIYIYIYICNIIAERFCFIFLPFGLVWLRTFRLVHGLVRCTHWVQVFTCARGGCDNQRCHNKNPR